MARLDCRDEAISLAESCLGEAQFQTAYTRFSNLCRATPAAARPDGPDHVLRAIGAGISKLLQMPGADPVAVYYRYKGAADAYAEAGGTDPSGRVQARLLSLREKAEAAEEARSLPPSSAASVRSSHDWLWENCGLVSPSRFRRRDLGDEAPPAPDFFAEASGVGPIHEDRSRSREAPLRSSASDEPVGGVSSARALLPERSLPHHYDLASTAGNNSGQDAALLAIVQEMRRQREQDAKERAEQLKSMREEKSVFTYSLRDDLPVFGDGDSDLDKHLEAFSDVCMVVKPKGDREKLRLFARTLKGTRRRCYDTIIKEAKHNGDYESKPASVFDRVVAALDASFHESDEAKAMKARARYDGLEKRASPRPRAATPLIPRSAPQFPRAGAPGVRPRPARAASTPARPAQAAAPKAGSIWTAAPAPPKPGGAVIPRAALRPASSPRRAASAVQPAQASGALSPEAKAKVLSSKAATICKASTRGGATCGCGSSRRRRGRVCQCHRGGGGGGPVPVTAAGCGTGPLFRFSRSQKEAPEPPAAGVVPAPADPGQAPALADPVQPAAPVDAGQADAPAAAPADAPAEPVALEQAVPADEELPDAGADDAANAAHVVPQVMAVADDGDAFAGLEGANEEPPDELEEFEEEEDESEALPRRGASLASCSCSPCA